MKDIVGVQFRNMATIGGSIWGRFGFSDVLTVFLAMDSYVELYKGGIVSMADFVSMKMDNDILLRVIVKKRACQIAYMAVRNQSTDFPVLTCCVSKLDGTYRAVIGARPKEQNLLLMRWHNGKWCHEGSYRCICFICRRTGANRQQPAWQQYLPYTFDSCTDRTLCGTA